ncbi:Protein of unknown function [Gryllus bimaculatus]|nr:Protein of unknown function [Gryllus bimaculatus]
MLCSPIASLPAWARHPARLLPCDACPASTALACRVTVAATAAIKGMHRLRVRINSSASSLLAPLPRLFLRRSQARADVSETHAAYTIVVHVRHFFCGRHADCWHTFASIRL